MLNVALLSALSYFICYAGNWMFGQSMSDRPIFIGAVTGLLLGDLQQGLIIGATLEAVFMGVCQYRWTDISRSFCGNRICGSLRNQRHTGSGGSLDDCCTYRNSDGICNDVCK